MLQVFGGVDNPLGRLGSSYGEFDDAAATGGGIIGFLGNIIKLITVVAGIFVMFNFLIAGLDYITGQGDPKSMESAKNKMTYSIIGLAIMVGTFALTALLGKVLFGSYDAILKPTIYGPGT